MNNHMKAKKIFRLLQKHWKLLFTYDMDIALGVNGMGNLSWINK